MTGCYVEEGGGLASIVVVGCGALPAAKCDDRRYARRAADGVALFEAFAAQAPDKAVAVFEGIHRSRRRAAEWKAVCSHPRATVTFDLYDLGIVFLHPKLNSQHYLVNF